MSESPRPPLRVLFVAGSLGGGGAERRLVDLLKHLDPQRIQPRLYLSFRRGELLSELPENIPADAFWDGVSKRSFGQRVLAKLRWPCGARALHLREVLRQHPVDAVVSWSLMCGYEVMLATRDRQLPHITCSVCQPHAELNEVFPRGFPFRFRLAQHVYRSAQIVAANSAALCEIVKEFYRLNAERVTLFSGYRDFQRIEDLSREANSIEQIPRPRIVAIGRLHPDKGFDVLIHAVQLLQTQWPTVQLAILGQGPAEAELRRLTHHLGLDEQVHFLGFQSNPYPALRSADVFVLSSRREGLPGVLLEALACRVPVVATDCNTGPREILGGGERGRLVPVDDAAAMAESLGQMLASPPSPEARDTAHQWVLETFGIQAGVRRFEQLVERAIGCLGSSPA